MVANSLETPLKKRVSFNDDISVCDFKDWIARLRSHRLQRLTLLQDQKENSRKSKFISNISLQRLKHALQHLRIQSSSLVRANASLDAQRDSDEDNLEDYYQYPFDNALDLSQRTDFLLLEGRKNGKM